MKTSANFNQSSTESTMVTCPACGLLCDDVVLSSTSPIKVKTSCVKSIDFFEQTYSRVTPSIAGKATDLETAIKTAAQILDKSNQPLFAGLGTEVQGMRALLRLAEKTSATLDHMYSESTVRNTLALQNSGWQTTTLTEVKNRADVILAIGTNIVSSHPRFFEKLVWNKDSLFNKSAPNKSEPEVVYLGNATDTSTLPELMNALNALANGKKLHTDAVAGVKVESLTAILDKLKAAQYAVVVWSASNLNFAHAELTIQSITRLIAKLNETTRVAGLPLNSGDGDTSINNTNTWLSGYATRSRLANGQAEYDTYRFSTKQQIKQCDALLWVSTFNAYAPPQIDAPTIVIGHPNTQFAKVPDVFIPVGLPGLDHTGTMFRMDSAVALPLKKVRDNNLATLAQVMQKLLDALPC
ncbi:MAG TPA: formylmethanofuran dehydrogenase [Methylotenera sp.]|nr:formylmethanofuran dehydrogenase [Methylotenera sp.]